VVAFAFHAVVRGMYLHAERLLAKAGASKCKERGITHPWNEAQREWKGRSAAEGCTSEARKPGETPCPREGRTPLRKVWLPYSCASAHMTYRANDAGVPFQGDRA
jgi:hypothetical protein